MLISSPSFKVGTNVKINLDVKSKEVEMVKTEPNVKPKVITRPNIEPNKEHKQDVKPNIKFDRESNQDVKEPDTNEITYEEERKGCFDIGNYSCLYSMVDVQMTTFYLSLS